MDFKDYLNSILQNKAIAKWGSMYVPLPLTESSEEMPSLPLIREMVLPGQVEGGEEKPFFESTELLKRMLKPEMSPFILAGDSGAGKTTTLKWIAFNLAKIALRNLETSGQIQNIPVYLELGSFYKTEFIDFVLLCFEEKRITLHKDELIPLLKEGKFVFLIDGLDLLPPSNEVNPLQAVQGFVSKYTKNNFLLTCRTSIYYPVFPDNYRIIKCLELSDEKIVAYLSFYIKDTQKRERILNQIMTDQQLREVSRTPLVLILETVAFLKAKEIPKKRVGIYTAYMDCLYTLFEKEIGGFGPAEKRLLQDILSELGFNMAMENKSLISEEEMLEIISTAIVRNNYQGLDNQKIISLCRQLGFLRIEEGDVEFFYQTYKDYFAAYKLKEFFLKKMDLSSIYNHPRWEDTVVFLAGLLSPEQATNLIQTIVKLHYEWRDPLFLAARCAAESVVTDKCFDEVVGLLGLKLKDKFWFNQKESLYGLTRLLGKIENLPDDSDLKKSYLSTIEAFSHRLKDKDCLRRERIARSLTKMYEKDALPHLKRLLDNDDPAIYNAAYEAIVEVERQERELRRVSLSGLQKEKEAQIEEISHLTGNSTSLTALTVSVVRSPELLRQLDETKIIIRNQLYENIFRPTIDMCWGVIVRAIGTNLVITFENPKDAVYAAIKMQSGVDDYNLRQPSRKVYLRIGLYTEEILAEAKEAKQHLLKTSLRIGKLARGGQILLAAQTYKAVHGEDKSIHFRYLGSRRLKEGDEKNSLYELLWQDKGQVSMIKESIMAVEYLDVISAFNMTKNKLIASKVIIAKSFFNRLKGLRLTKNVYPFLMEVLQPGGKRVSFNPILMLAPIDILLLDAEFKIIELMEWVLPFNPFKPKTYRRYYSQWPVKYIMELPAGSIKAAQIEVNDIVVFKERLV